MINFIRYNNSGDIEAAGFMSKECIEWEKSNGALILEVDLDDHFNTFTHKIDLETGKIVQKPTPPNPPPPEPVIHIPPISDRQFYQQAALDGYITQSDALAAVQTGFIPAILQELVDETLDPDEKFNAQMLLAGATVFYRQHPLTARIGEAFGLTTTQLDQFWMDAAKL